MQAFTAPVGAAFKPGCQAADVGGVSEIGIDAAACQLAGAQNDGGRRGAPGRPRRTRPRRAFIASGVMAAAAVALTATLGLAGGAQATQAPTAGALMKLALNDALARSSVHETESQKSSTVSGTTSADIGKAEGRQDISHSDGARAHVLVIGGTAFVSGNQTALTRYYGFPAAIAKKVGSNWVSAPSSSSGYAVITAGVTLSSAIDVLAIPGHLTETSATKINGQSAIGIQNKAVSTGSKGVTVAVTMYVSQTSKPLPIRVTFDYSNGASTVVAFSGWDEPLALKAPAHAIPVASLH
jgi:hypothetical protein